MSTSPDRKVVAEVFLDKSGVSDSVLHYRVSFRDRPVILDSPFVWTSEEEARWAATASSMSRRPCESRYILLQYPGKRSKVVDRCTETVISMHETGMPRKSWQLIVRAYDDGVALRYRIPRQDGWPRSCLPASGWISPCRREAVCWALPLNGFTTPYEKRYVKKTVAELPADWLLGMPLLVELPGTGWAAITEANLTDHAGMYLRPRSRSERALSPAGSRRCPASRPSPCGRRTAARLALAGHHDRRQVGGSSSRTSC